MGETNTGALCQKESTERNYLFDNCKALLIFLVAAIHMSAAARSACGAETVPDILMLTASSFHMPLFMMISGYFSKRVKRERVTDAVIIYLTAQALFFVFDFFFTYGMSFRKITVVGILSPGFSMWYLFALIFLRLFHREISSMRYSLAIAAVISIAVMGCNMDTAGRQAVVKTIAHAIYFIIGMNLTPEHIKMLRRFPKWVYAVGFAAGAGVLVVMTVVFRLLSANTLRLMTIRAKSADDLGGGIKPYLMYVFVTLMALYMSAMILGLMTDRKTKFSIFGSNTVTVYIVQAFAYLIYCPVAKRLSLYLPSIAVYILGLMLAALCVAGAGNSKVAGLFSEWVSIVEKKIFKARG